MREGKRGPQLYVKRVFIMEDAEALLPDYLRFVKGVVDAHDLSLNISREILQQDRQIQAVQRRLVKKVLATVRDLQEKENEKYQTFWREFGRAVKEGLINDQDNQSAILEILSAATTHDADQVTTLRDYIGRMKDGQQHIYYMTGESRAMIENSPHMERSAPRASRCCCSPTGGRGLGGAGGRVRRQAAAVDREGPGRLESEEEKAAAKPEQEQRKKDFAGLLTWMTGVLDENVKEVRLSSRLTTSAACIVGDDQDVTPTLEKMYRAMGQEVPHVKRILELNATHPLVTGLRSAHEAVPPRGCPRPRS